MTPCIGALQKKYMKGFFLICQGILQFLSINSQSFWLRIYQSLMEQSIQKINPMDHQNVQKNKTLRFPTLNISHTPRILNQRINGSRTSLLRYREPIIASNRNKDYQQDYISSSYLKKFQEQDGLIYQLKRMKFEVQPYLHDQVRFFREQGRGVYPNNFRNQMEYFRREIKREPTPNQLDRMQRQMGNIKILVCVCMYNESKNAINLTLNGIYRNLSSLKKEGITDKDIAVVLIQDGILKLVQNRKKRTLAKGEDSMVKFYEKMDEEQGKNQCDLLQRIHTILDETENYDRQQMSGNVQRNKEIPPSIQKNVSLMYQNLWKPSRTDFQLQQDTGIQTALDTDDQLMIFSCFKHTNGTKLSSHLLFFEGFCRFLNPEFCVLLDVGTVPDQTGITNLIKGLSQDQNYGGATGFMSVDSNFPSQEGGEKTKQTQNCFMKCAGSIQKAQEYEYIIAHFIDKNCESALGFLHVLPGAWSAYRYKALITSQKNDLNLLERSYFKMILNPNLQQKDFREANMYLAEDRILSLGIYTQTNCQFTLKYVPNAIAYTDPMKNHKDLMNQRRRWINSSLFAFLYVFKNYYYNVMNSNHNFARKYITIFLSMVMALLSTLNAYITPAIYMFVLYSTIFQIGFEGCQVIAKVVTLMYVLIFLSGVAGALTGKQWAQRAGLLSAVFSFFTFLMLLLVIYNILFVYLQITGNPAAEDLEKQGDNFDRNNLDGRKIMILIMTVINLSTFIALILSHLLTHPRFVIKLLCNTFSYLSYTGAYAQTMVIHGFCNVDDVSWGTKGSTAQGKNKYETKKVFFVSTWLFVNTVLAFILIYVDIISLQNGNNKTGGIMLIILAIYGTVVICIKTILALSYHFWQFFQQCCYHNISSDLRAQAVDAYWKKMLGIWKSQKYNSQIRNIQGGSLVDYES